MPVGSRRTQFTSLVLNYLRLSIRNWRFWAFGMVMPVLFSLMAGVLTVLIDVSPDAHHVSVDHFSFLEYVPVLSERNVSQFLVDVPREGGWSPSFELFNTTDGGEAFVKHIESTPIIYGGGWNFIDYDDHATEIGVVVLYNASVPHSLSFFSQLVTEAAFERFLGKRVKLIEQTFPVVEQEAARGILFTFFGPLMLTYSLAFFMVSFAQRVVEEREQGTKHALLMAGARLEVLWLAQATAHYIVYLAPAILVLVVLSAFGAVAVSYNTPMASILLVLMFGPPLIGEGYLISFLFDKADTCRRWTRAFTTLIILVPYMLVTIALDNPNVLGVQYLLCLFPNYAFYRGWTVLALNAVEGTPLTAERFFNPDTQIIVILCIMLLETLLFAGAIMAIESGMVAVARTNRNATEPGALVGVEDEDVARERQRILVPSDRGAEAVRVTNVSKQFILPDGSTKWAVSELTFGVARGECFGLLGPNGAGKTTTVKMMCGMEVPSCGDLYVGSAGSVVTRMREVHAGLGVCPQHDALWPELSGREHLMLFAAIRGVPEEEQQEAVEGLVSKVNLGEHIDVQTKAYSGGTKRKLSLALAFVGSPEVVLLDEPSSGMDPLARRGMWEIIASMREETNCSVVVTTHSMEEADALCSRVGIMVQSRLRCIGTVQHLKNTHGGGYRLVVASAAERTSDLTSAVLSTFTAATVVSEFNGTVQFDVPRETTCLADLFTWVVNNKEQFEIADYSVSQTTLEQVFLAMCREQGSR